MGLSRSGPDHVGVGRIDGQGTDGLGRLVIKNRLPVHTAVYGLEHSPGSGTEIVDVGITGNTNHRTDPIPYRPDMPVLEVTEEVTSKLGNVLSLTWERHPEDDQKNHHQPSQSRPLAT